MKILQILLIVALATPLNAQITETYTDFIEGTSFQFTTEFTQLRDSKGKVIDEVQRIQIPKVIDLSFFNLTKDKWKVISQEEFSTNTYSFRVIWNVDLSKISTPDQFRSVRKHYVIYYSRDHPSENSIEYFSSGIATSKLEWKCEKDGFYTIIYRQNDLLTFTILEHEGFTTSRYNGFNIPVPKYP